MYRNNIQLQLPLINQCIQNFKSIILNKEDICDNKNICTQACYYQMAKQEETKERNLVKALQFYVKAVLNGEKINSSIKDFAAVLHQCGLTKQAIHFMKEMSHFYTGDKIKYERLLLNLQLQINPTGKHNYVKILFDFRQLGSFISAEFFEAEVLQMFKNSSRIKQISRHSNLSFKQKSTHGRYALLQFDTFSAAKKTLETFHREVWFGIDKYWVDTTNNIIAYAENGRQDFEDGIVSRQDIEQKKAKLSERYLTKWFSEKQEKELQNLISLIIIESIASEKFSLSALWRHKK